MEEYGGADYDYGGSDSGTYNYEYDAYSAGMDGRDRDAHAYRDDNRSAGLNLGTDDGERRRGARARTGRGSREISSYSSREDGRDRDRDIERGTGRGHPGADSVAYRSRYAESVFDAADHPGNAHLYDRGSGGTQYGYEDNDRDRDRERMGQNTNLMPSITTTIDLVTGTEVGLMNPALEDVRKGLASLFPHLHRPPRGLGLWFL